MPEQEEKQMTDTNEFKKLSDEFSESLKKINNNLDDVKEEIREQKEISKKPQPKEDDFSSNLFADDDLKIQKKVDEALAKNQEKLNARQAYDDSCKEWDTKAFEEIPELNDPTVRKIVLEEMNKMMILGVDENSKKKLFPPDALYNAAYRVKSKNSELFKKVFEDMDTGGYNKTIKGVTITDTQMQLAALMGVSEARAREIYKPWNEKKAMKMKR